MLSAQCNSSALTVCVFLFNVTNNTVLVLLVSSLLILLSILLYLLRCRRPVRLNVRLTRLFTVEFRVSIDNFLECRAKPVVLVVVVTCISSPSSSSCVLLCLEESWSWSHRSLLQFFRCRKSWPVPLQISVIGRPSNLQPFYTQVHQKHCTWVPLLCVCTSSLFNVKTVLIKGVCGVFTVTPPSAAGACPGMNGSSSSR